MIEVYKPGTEVVLCDDIKARIIGLSEEEAING